MEGDYSMKDFNFKSIGGKDFVEERAIEQMQATIVEQQAYIDYIAMMSDIDIPTLNKEVGANE